MNNINVALEIQATCKLPWVKLSPRLEIRVKELGSRKFVGTVGELQFEVLQYRLEHEYGAKCRFEPRAIHKACWMTGDANEMKEFMKYRQQNIAYDKAQNPVFLAETAFILRTAMDKHPDITFHLTSEAL